MPDTPKRSLSHIYLQKHGKREKYTRNSGGGGQYMPPPRERFLHAKQLQDSLANAIGTALEKLEQRDPTQATGTPGLYLDIELIPESKKVLDSLEDRRKGKEPIELLTVTKAEDGKLNATVFVPQSRLDVYTKKIDEYADPGKDIAPNKPKNEKLVASIETIRLSNLQLLFTDALPSFPKTGQEVWWEIWLRIGTRSHFEHTARQLGIQFSEHSVKFVEREVLLALAKPELLAQLLELTDALAEVRLAKDNPTFFMRLSPYEQKAWSQELTGRFIPPADDAPAVCLLDSGTTYRHPLIQPALNPKDQQAWQSSWSVEDTGKQWQGHGTEMSGIALYGDLVDIFNFHEPVALTHCLESVKILPDTGQNNPELYGLETVL